MSDNRPAPMTSADMDVRDLDGFMLNVERLLASELWALTKEQPLAFRGAVGLWARAWKQIPPASLPDNEAVIAAFADMPMSKFRKLRDLVMRNFVLCSDGRYYHTKLSEEVCKIWPSVAKKRRDRDADNERLRLWRESKRRERETGPETRSETDDETRFTRDKKPVANGVDTDRDRDTDRDKEGRREEGDAGAPNLGLSLPISPEKPLKTSKKKPHTSLPEGFPNDPMLHWAVDFWKEKGRLDLCRAVADEREKFRDRAQKLDEKYADWVAAWRHWCRNAIKFNKDVSYETRNGRNEKSANQSFGSGVAAAVARRNSGGLFDSGREAIDLSDHFDDANRDRIEGPSVGKIPHAA